MSSDDPAEAALDLASQSNFDAVAADLESRHVAVTKERDEFRQKAESLEDQVKEIRAELSSRDESLRTMEAELAAAKRDRQVSDDRALTSEAALKTQQERMDRTEAEADALREEISRLADANKEMMAKLAEADTKKLLSSSAAIPLQYELERVRKELDSLSSHNKWLEAELTFKSNQLSNSKTEHSKELIDLRSKLDKAVADLELATSQEDTLLRTREELQAKVDQLSTQLFQQQQEATDSALATKDELVAERRLVDLQKEQLERMEHRYNDLSKQAKQMKELASQAAAESRTERERIREDLLKESEKALEQQADEYGQRIAELEKQLEEANRRRIEAEDGLMASPPSRRTRALLPAAAGDSTGMVQGEQEPLGLTDLYARLSEREDELRVERTERRRLELYQRKILAEMEAKAPVLLRQRQEYELALEKYKESTARLEEAFDEMTAAKTEASDLRKENSSLERKTHELEQENMDLAKQVQRLLQKCAGSGGSSTEDTAGDDLPVCTTIEEIQDSNQRLMREHRRLTNTVAELEKRLETEPLHLQLEKAKEELSNLRQDRQRQETLVAGIVQQRDLYRALLAKHDSSILDGGDGAESTGDDATAIILAQQKEKTREIESRNRQLEDDLATVKAELSSATLAKEAAEERVARYDTHSVELTNSIDKMQSQLSAAHAATARSDAEASYHREKCVRLEETLQMSRSETTRANEAKREMQMVNAELQQALAVAHAEAGKHEQQFRQASMKLRLAETQVETAKSAEARVALEANSLRSELARQGALLDSVQRIEATLSAKAEEEKKKLVEDTEQRLQTMASERSKSSIELENHQSRVRELEVSMKETEKKKDEALSELLQVKKEALDVSSEKQALSAKCSRLESELRIAKTKLGQGDADTEEEQTMQTRVEVLTAELESTRSELTAAKERVVMYQTMSKTSEDALADLNQATEEYKKTHTVEMEKAQKDIESLKALSESKQEMIVELTRDLSNQRGEQEKVVSELNVQIESLKQEAETFKEDSESAKARFAALDSDITNYRDSATAAQNNYERELALHAAARTDLRAAREEADSEIRRRKIAEEQLESLTIERNEERKVWEEERGLLEGRLAATEKSLEDSRAQNDNLHSQLATLGDMLEKTQSEKIASLSNESKGGDEPGDCHEELNSLRKIVSEQREVVSFMRSEREMIQAQLDAARRTAERERAAFEVSQRNLDEARAELKLLQSKEGDSNADDKSRELEEKLKNSEEQLTLLRESNKLLREESEKIESSLALARAELANVKNSTEPAEASRRLLEVEKAALEAEKASLVRELEAWKGRVQSLVSKFHQIDPEEHERVLGRVEELQKDCEELKSQKSNIEKENSNAKLLLSRVKKELAQQRALVETQGKTISKLSSEKEAAAKSSKASAQVNKEIERLKTEVQKMRSQASSRDTELNGANERNESLKVRLRQFQKTIIEMRKERDSAKSKIEEMEREKATERTPPLAPATQGEEQREDNSPSVSGKVRLPVASTGKAAQKEETKALPRVPPGGFKFGPGIKSKAVDQPIQIESTTADSHPKANDAVIETGADTAATTDPVDIANAPSDAPAAKESNENSTTAIRVPENMHVDPPVAEAARAAGPKKRKMEEEVKTHELSMREKLMEKKRRLAELKKAKEAAESAEDKTDHSDDTTTEPVVKKVKLSLDAKPFAPAPTADKAAAAAPDAIATSEASGPESSKPDSPPPQIESTTPLEAEAEGNVGPSIEVEKPLAEADPTTPVEDEVRDESSALPAPEQNLALSSDSEPAADPVSKPESVEVDDALETKVPESKQTAVSPFGGSGTTSTPIVFGSSTSVVPSLQAPTTFGTRAESGSAAQESTSKFGSSFLNIKPPGSSSEPFTFGSRASITLPTPSKHAGPTAPSFGIFGQPSSPSNPFGSQSSTSNPFGGGAPQAKPLFAEPENDGGEQDQDDEQTTDFAVEDGVEEVGEEET